MRQLTMILGLAALLTLLACGGNTDDEKPAAEAAIAIADDVPAPAGQVFGAGVSGGSTIQVSELLAHPDQYVGKVVRVRGPVARVCRHAGCWLDLTSDTNNDLLRLQVTEGEIVFPLSLEGQVAMAEGVVEALPMTYAQSCAYLEQEAARRGEAFDKDAVPAEGITTYRIMGTGAVALESPAP